MEYSYLFTLSYARRGEEKRFIKDILCKFDNQKLVGANLFVNNNPYNLGFYLHLNFEGKEHVLEFERWLKENYPNKTRKYNYFIGDLLYSMGTRGYNSAGLLDGDELDFLLTPEPNFLFLFPDQARMSEIFGGGRILDDFRVFLSHSSKDKDVVDIIFDELQKAEIRAWYDRYEIDPGDSIVDKINEGLSNSDIGILLLSHNFLNPTSGWTKSEMNYLIQRRINRQEKDFICLNLGMKHEELPALVQEYRYIDLSDKTAIDQLIMVLKKAKLSKTA